MFSWALVLALLGGIALFASTLTIPAAMALAARVAAIALLASAAVVLMIGAGQRAS